MYEKSYINMVYNNNNMLILIKALEVLLQAFYLIFFMV